MCKTGAVCGFAIAALLASGQPDVAQDVRHADLARYFFASPEAERKDRAALDAQLADLEARKATLTRSAADLAAALAITAKATALYLKHENYLHFACAEDQSQTQVCDDDDTIAAGFDSRTAFVASAVAAMPDDVFAQFQKDPALAAFAYSLAEMRRGRAHDAGAAAEGVIAKLSAQITDWQYPLSRLALGQAEFGTVATPQGPLDVQQQRVAIALRPDRHVREDGFHKRYAGFARVRDTQAFALLHIAAAGNALAQLRHFDNAPDAKYFALGLDPAATRRLIARASESGALLKRVEDVHRADVQRVLHIAEPAPWDMRVPLTTIAPRTLDDARMLYHQTFATLGADYIRPFDALLDPANKRTDIAFAAVPHRYGGGFSVGPPGGTSLLFVGNFGGAFKDISVIAHEGGHAVHRALMSANGVSPLYAQGPNYLFESFAIFNELLLADTAIAHAKSDAERRYYIAQFLDIKGTDYILGADDAALEQAIYEGAAKGTLHNADDLDTLTLKIDSQFSQWPAKYPEMKSRWASSWLAYEDPLYNVNYLYGGLLALQYYRMWQHAPADFAPCYVALLKNGFNDTPANLLKRFLDVDLTNDTTLLDNASGAVEEKLKLLEHN